MAKEKEDIIKEKEQIQNEMDKMELSLNLERNKLDLIINDLKYELSLKEDDNSTLTNQIRLLKNDIAFLEE